VRTDASRAGVAGALAACLLLAACREETKPEIPTGRLARASGESRRTLRALVPEECRAGEVFQRLETGEASLLVLGTGLGRGDTVFWNGRPLRTAFGHSRLVSAAVPPELIRSPGRVVVTVEDTIDPSQPKLRAEFLVAP
jgi:hypothetical protein